MALQDLGPGESIAGMLVDDLDGTPYVAATLIYDPETGVRVEVPFIENADRGQFREIVDWFNNGRLPENLVFRSIDGDIGLFSCARAGGSRNVIRGISVGLMIPDIVVLKDRKGALDDQLTFERLASRIDGLAEFSQLSALEHGVAKLESGLPKEYTLRARSAKSVSWRQGEATLSLDSNWSAAKVEDGLQVTDQVTIASTFPAPRSLDEHLEEQRKVVAFLTLTFGEAIHFRGHKIQDSRFTEKAPNEKCFGGPPYDLISRQTFKEFSQPTPDKRALLSPLARLDQVGDSGMARWSKKYDEWARFIHPVVGALARPHSSVEEQVLSAALSLEAAGHLINTTSGEEPTYRNGSTKPTTATYLYRCLKFTREEWSDASISLTGLAKALADNCNTIKHFNRGSFPEPIESYLVGIVMFATARLIAIMIVNPSLADTHESKDMVRRAQAEFRSRGLAIDDSGSFVRQS